jgi:hypothetical protein
MSNTKKINELKSKIEKLKKGMSAKAATDSAKSKAKVVIAKYEKEIESLQVKPKRKTTKTTQTSVAKARLLAAKRRAIQGLSTSKSDIEKDAQRPALPAGKRISENGNVYYENRENRIDRRPKKYARLEDGGEMMAKGGKLDVGVYRVGKPTKVSPNLYEQKIVEIFDNGDIATASDYGRSLSDFKVQKYPIISKERLKEQYKYADGGEMMAEGGEMMAKGGIFTSSNAKKTWDKYDEYFGRTMTLVEAGFSEKEAKKISKKSWESLSDEERKKFKDALLSEEIDNMKGMMVSLFTYGGLDKDNNFLYPYKENLGERTFNKIYDSYSKELESQFEVDRDVYTDQEGLSYSSLKRKFEDGGEMMAKGGIYSSDDVWFVTFQNQDSGEFEKIRVRANNKKNAIDIAEDEGGLGTDWKYYSAEKEMADGGEMAFGGRLKSALMRDRAYQSDEEHEKRYVRKSGSSRYQKHEMGGEMHRSEDSSYANGGMLEYMIDSGFSIAQMKEYLRGKFPDSFGFTLARPDNDMMRKGIMKNAEDTPFRGLTDADINNQKVYFPQYKRDHEINFRIHQGGENTYFEFYLNDEEGNPYVGNFGFKDRGDVSPEYITGFIVFLMECYKLPIQVRHEAYGNGGMS